MQKVKTAISIDHRLLEETESIAQEMDIPKSQVVSQALEDFIRNYRNKQLLAQINAAYANEPDAEDQATLAIIRSHRRKLGEHDEWK
ncbi:MAG TPA: ribbon-helix-helix domain-containing protein [Anaerolinea sp.]|nr:ribbon-helix-helix domain-containing protein [Anaerolinea sp.]